MSRPKVNDSRLNLRLTIELHEWAKQYAERQKTSITEILTKYLVSLKEAESANK